MNLPIIILNYNSSSDCQKCVSFLKQQKEVDLEIIIVDNCSPNAGEFNNINSLCKEQNCTFLPAPENKGYNAGNNIGLRYAAEKGYKYAVIANPDMEFPQPDYFSKMVAKMEEDEEIVVLGTDIISPEGIHQNPMERDGRWYTSFGWITGLFKHKKSDTYDFIDCYPQSHYCAKVSGCCLMVRLDFLRSIGFFDENVFLYCEEAILSRQVEIAGKRMFYIADSQSIHRHIKNEKGDPIKRFRNWRDSRIYFINKYSDDSWLGKKIACLSMRMYVSLFTLAKRLK